MPKYRNKSQFVRPLIVNGKRSAVPPSTVFYSERELDLEIYNYLELVDEKTPVAKVLKELGPKKISTVKPEEVSKVKTQVTEMQKTIDTLKNASGYTIEQLKSNDETILKRLEIMKNAITEIGKTQNEILTIVHELEKEVYENGFVVIEDEEQKKD